MSAKRGRQEFVESLKPEYLIKENNISKETKEKKTSEDTPDKGERELGRQKNMGSPRKTIDGYYDLAEKEIDSSGALDGLFPDFFKGQEITFSEPQKLLLKKIVDLEARRMGILVPNIDYRESDDPGLYNHRTQTIWLSRNVGTYKDLRDLVDTVIHETRHCYQFCIMEHPDAFDDIPMVLKVFLQKSLADYPKRIETEKEWDSYIKNGLEVDTNAYAESITTTYQQFTINEILEMKNPPEEIVKNQILMTPSDISEDGRIAPLFVSADFNEAVVLAGIDTDLNNTEKRGGCSMSGRRSLNISDEKQREAIGFYENIIREIQSSSGVMANQLGELLRNNPYEQTQKAANAFLSYYNTTLPSEIGKAITEWRNSDNCISAAVKKMHGGEAAVQNAKRYEDRLLETVKNCFMTIDEFKVDVAGLNTTDQAINEMSQMINSYKQRFETNADSWIRSVSSKEQEEMIYSCIHDVVSKTIVNVRGAFDGLHVIFDEVGIQFSDSHSSITGANIDKGTASSAQQLDLKSRLLEMGHLAGF